MMDIAPVNLNILQIIFVLVKTLEQIVTVFVDYLKLHESH